MTAPASLPDSALPSRLPNAPDLPDETELRTRLPIATSEQLAEFLWLLAEAGRRGMTTYAAIGAFINRDAATMSKLFRGKYEASLQPLAAHIQHVRLSQAEQAAAGEEPYVAKLSVVTEIGQFCDLTRAVRQISQIYGKNQTGKSKALQHYAGSHADTVYWKLPAGGGTNKSMATLAEAMGISSRKSDTELWERLRRRLTRHSLLLVDEFHQAVHAGRRIQTVTVDRVRELHDDCGCGVVLCGTEHVAKAFESPKHAEFLAQTGNRGRLRLYIPTPPTKEDFAAICTAYSLPKPEGEAGTEARKVARENGIAALTDLLAIARRIATKKDQSLNWDFFLTAVATVKSYGNENRTAEDSL